jgi:hypothetical protein
VVCVFETWRCPGARLTPAPHAAGWIVYAGVAEGHCLLYEVDRRAQENFVGEVRLR